MLLAVALLGAGSSAWGQSTVYERGTTNAWAATDVSTTEWVALNENTGTNLTEGIEGSLAVTNNTANSSSNAAYVTKTISITENKVIQFVATWNPGNATGNNDNTYAYIQIGDIKCLYYGSGTAKANIQIGDVTTTLNSGTGLRNKDWSISLFIDQTTGIVSYSIGLNASTYTGHGTTNTANGDFSSVVFGHGGKKSTWANTTTLKKVSILEGDGYSYTVKAVDDSDVELKVFDAGAMFADGTKTIYYPMAIKIEDTWYKTTAKGSEPYYGVNISSTNNETKKITYTETSEFDYFFEGDDLIKSDNSAWAANTGTPGRMSSGNASRLRSNKYVYTEALEGGVYDVTIRVRNQRGATSTETFYCLYLRDGEGNVSALESNFAVWANGKLETRTIEGIVIPNGYSFQINAGTSNSNLEIDYLTFKKVTSASGTITDCGWSTFASNYNLDLSGVTNGTAYYASAASGSTVTLTPCDDKIIEAGEGIMVKGTPGATFTIPVTASDATFSATNYLKGQTTTGNVEASTPGTYHYVFGFSKTDASVYGFYNLTAATEVAAGKAYLETTEALSSGASRLNIVFDDEATGINTVQGEGNTVNGYYNLSGQQVSQPTKGLYIVNGKKVIIK